MKDFNKYYSLKHVGLTNDGEKLKKGVERVIKSGKVKIYVSFSLMCPNNFVNKRNLPEVLLGYLNSYVNY